MSGKIKYSIILLTFKRDDIIKENIDHLSKSLIDYCSSFEIVLIDNNEDDVDRSSYLKNVKNRKYIKPGVNKGVAGGRNLGLKNSTGEFLLFIDDDAFIYPRQFFNIIGKTFTNNPKVGILGFKSIDYYTKKPNKGEFPHRNKKLINRANLKTSRFIGVAHIIKREIFESVGLYEDDFIYMHEEWDLSYKAIKKGYEILYTSEVYVYHKYHPAGRLLNLRKYEMALLNKLKVGYLHLPFYALISTGIIWAIYGLWKTKFHIRIYQTLVSFNQWLSINKGRREVLTSTSIKYINSTGNYIWLR